MRTHIAADNSRAGAETAYIDSHKCETFPHNRYPLDASPEAGRQGDDFPSCIGIGAPPESALAHDAQSGKKGVS